MMLTLKSEDSVSQLIIFHPDLSHLERFQWFIAILFTIGFNTGSILVQTLGLLEMEPKFLCFKDPMEGEFPCKSIDICEHPTWKYRIDENNHLSLHNWF